MTIRNIFLVVTFLLTPPVVAMDRGNDTQTDVVTTTTSNGHNG